MGPGVRLLLDTCTFIWLSAAPERLSDAAREALDSDANDLFLSHVSIWEIHLKHLAQKLTLPQKPRLWISRQLAARGLSDWPIDLETIHGASDLPNHHKDPFDRMLVAQADVHGFQIVTPDAAFQKYRAKLIW
jgi:PIN domain nuclease of toxin-antitoxin system